MLSFGLCVAGRFDGHLFEAAEPEEQTFYRELQPAFDCVDEEALAVSGLDREWLEEHGSDPADAMRDATEWIKDVSNGSKPVLVAFPLCFDWLFLYWYFIRFTDTSPFGFSNALDMKSIFQSKASVRIGSATKRNIPDELRGPHAHTHNALDDAVEQAEFFNRLFTWRPRV